jgi:hypothetical protein
MIVLSFVPPRKRTIRHHDASIFSRKLFPFLVPYKSQVVCAIVWVGLQLQELYGFKASRFDIKKFDTTKRVVSFGKTCR